MPLPFQNPRRASLTGVDATADRAERRRRLGWKCHRIRRTFRWNPCTRDCAEFSSLMHLSKP